jgi:hypothetical protein
MRSGGEAVLEAFYWIGIAHLLCLALFLDLAEGSI